MMSLSENGKNNFKYFFMEEGEQQQDPNAQAQDPNAQPAGPQPYLPDEEIEDNDLVEKEFPKENDGTTPEQDILNFTNYQKLIYFNKFKDLLKLVQKIEDNINKTKVVVSLDEVDDVEQYKTINLLVKTLSEIREQVEFILKKGIVSLNIDKLRNLFRAEVRKMNLVIDKFEEIIRYVNDKTDKK